MEETDAAALARAKAGDKDGFRLLVERHSRSVFRLAYRLTGNEQDAEDVVQETFLRAYKQLRNFESRASFGTWLYRIAANYSLDLIRARKRHQENRPAGYADVNGEADALLSIPAPEPGPDRVAYSAQLEHRISSAMAALSEQERSAFVLRHLEACPSCRGQYAALQRVLNSLDAAPVPECAPDYGATVWRGIEARIPGRR